MSWTSDDQAYLHQMHREDVGTPIICSKTNTEHYVFVEEVAGAKAGTQYIPVEQMGELLAGLDPCIFNFSPEDFAPTTNVLPPVEGDEFIENARIYKCVHLHYENMDTDTNAILAYAHVKLPPPVAVI